jgi:hypothetical protein
MKKKELKRTKQCATCPWRVNADVNKIPNYDPELHGKLGCTIAEPGDIRTVYSKQTVMACHYSTPEQEEYCIGWLRNQLDEGNNIGMRMKMMEYSNTRDIEVFGPQHRNFRDTIPKQDEE